ncbi:hypothetical protein [Actinomadura violacea]|uniref:Uncharacterized protein n=1 Tax=Actinomadura violacea TaxID=2819934 RepID=A0ABS3S3L4_9ACTN|nr:hypothetical protein [Actinomadura violacea]MBO2463582.1 hypothetical protein [Actinomadura violacea]
MIRAGVGFYAFFGFGWLLAGLGHFGGATMGAACLLGLVVVLTLVFVARRLPSESADEVSQPLPPLQRRRFGQVNVVQWLLIAAIATGCGTGGVPELIMPLVAVVVGLHFLPLARVFADHRLVVPGAALTVIGIAGLVARFANASPGAVFTLVGVGCALTLWSTAAWSIAGVRRAVRP